MTDRIESSKYLNLTANSSKILFVFEVKSPCALKVLTREARVSISKMQVEMGQVRPMVNTGQHTVTTKHRSAILFGPIQQHGPHIGLVTIRLSGGHGHRWSQRGGR